MPRFFRWILILLTLLLVFVVSGFVLARVFEQPVKQYIVKEVNKRLASPMHVGDIHFSLIKKFPAASLVFEDVWAEENLIKIGEPDTLFYFQRVFLNFNVRDLIGGVYRINEIEAERGFFRMLIDEEGYENYRFWKSSEDTSGFFLELDGVSVSETEYQYANLYRDQYIGVLIDQLDFSGEFSKEEYTMDVDGKGMVDDFFIAGTNYLDNRDIAIKTALDIHAEKESYEFTDAFIAIDSKLKFKTSGLYTPDGLDLSVAGDDLDIVSTLSLIPVASRDFMDGYTSEGTVTFSAEIEGAFGKLKTAEVSAQFEIVDGTIRHSESGIELSALSTAGYITNGSQQAASSTSLKVDALSGLLNGDPVEAHFTITNFERPSISGTLKSRTSLESIYAFFQPEFLAEAQGNISIDATLKTTIRDINAPTIRDFVNASSSGSVQLTKATIKLPNDERRYSIDTASVVLRNNNLLIPTAVGKVNDCSINLEGSAKGFLSYIFSPDGQIEVLGKVKTGALSLADIFPESEAEESNAGGSKISFPKNAIFDLQIVSESFSQGKFVAEDISGKLQIDPFKVEAKSLHFVSQGGNVQGNIGIFQFSENQFGLRSGFEASDIDLPLLFSTFNNFSQAVVKSENLEGKANATVEVQLFCDSLFNLDLDALVATATLQLRNGKLKHLESMKSISGAIRDQKMVRLFVAVDELEKRLESIAFDKLENEINISNQKVTIPSMTIRSSAIDLNISGTHTFDNRIHYEMDFALSELLNLKNRTEPYNEYVKRDEQGKTRLFFTVTGTADDPIVEMKRTTLKQDLRDEVTKEKQIAKSILKQELGLFKSDSTLPAVAPVKKDPVRIEFDPEAGSSTHEKREVEKPTDQGSKPAGAKKKKSLLDRVLEKTENDRKKLEDGDFEDDDW